MWNIKKTEFYLEGLLHESGLTYITNKLHYRKCFVRILFTPRKTLETHSFATLTRSFLKFCDSWIKTRTVHFLWSSLFLLPARHCIRQRRCLPLARVEGLLLPKQYWTLRLQKRDSGKSSKPETMTFGTKLLGHWFRTRTIIIKANR